MDFIRKYSLTIDSEKPDKIIHSITNNIDKWLQPSILSACLGFIDLTTLNSTDTIPKVEKMVAKVNDFHNHFPDYPYPASICIYPNFSSIVKSNLTAKDVHVTAVAGSFPTSQSFLEVKALECRMAVESGADEIDIVLALHSFLDKDYDTCIKEIKEIKKAIGAAHLKVILETGALITPDNIANASMLAIESGADFIKTSTGKMEPAATPAAAIVMCNCIKAYYDKTGIKIGFKPAGGISSAKDAAAYYAIVETILGKEWLTPSLFRFGASRMANNILSELTKQSIIYY